MGDHVALMRDTRNTCKILAKKSEGKRPLEKPRHRWEDIKMYIKEMVFAYVEWIYLAQDMDQRLVLVKAIMKF
jgi:hypothetical protein